MPEDVFSRYVGEINKAYLRGDATESTHRPALKNLIESLDKRVVAVNEPRRIACGAPDLCISRQTGKVGQTIGYVETKDIGVDLRQAAKTEQIKRRYLPALRNLILSNYIEFWWYVDGELRLRAKLAEETVGGKFVIGKECLQSTRELLGWFLNEEPERITTAKTLAVRMGGLARLLRDVTRELFAKETKTGTLHAQFEAVREVLLHDLSESQFADMYAQTISYGLFTARSCIEDITLYGEDRHAPFHGLDAKGREL